VTTALHLAHAHQAPPGPKRKRKDGDGGDGYDAFVNRVWQDRRHSPESRELILAMAWLMCRDPNRYGPDGEQVSAFKRASDLLGYTGSGRHKRARIAHLLWDDRPRYEHDRSVGRWRYGPCEAPMIRRDGLCGQDGVNNTYTVDSDTGWHTPVWFCRRHEPWAAKIESARRAAPRVEPIPNTGGMLPAYLAHGDGDDGWARLYDDAATYLQERWTRPVKYPFSADRWPRPGEEPPVEEVALPRLRLAALDGELIGGDR
jgi:hypothetical protein